MDKHYTKRVRESRHGQKFNIFEILETCREAEKCHRERVGKTISVFKNLRNTYSVLLNTVHGRTNEMVSSQVALYVENRSNFQIRGL